MFRTLQGHSTRFAVVAVATISVLALPGGAVLAGYHTPESTTHSRPAVSKDQSVATTTTLASSDTAPVVGETVVYTATVAPVAPDTGTPTGTVTISGDSGILCTATLNESDPDEASCNFSYTQIGSDTVTASYNGDDTYETSTSDPSSESISEAATTTSIGAAPTTSVVGQSVTYTATVAASSPGSGTPTGEVDFTDTGGTICSGTLDGANSDQASCTTSYPTVGTDSVTANYLGDGNYQSSSSDAVEETIDQAATETDISASPTNPVVGQPVTYTATVTTTAPGSGTPTGSVSFVDTAGTLCTNPLDQSSPDQATCQTTYTTSENDSITATYEGDTNFSGSESSPYSESVSPDATTTTLSADQNSPVVGQNVTYTATVAVNAPGSGTPTGNVTFSGGADNTICVTALDQDATDQATCTVSYPSIGSEVVTAAYDGDTNDQTSTSSPLSLTVSQDSTSTSIKSSDTSPVVGEIVTFTATVAAASPGSGTPTGSVTFTGDAGTLCTVNLNQQSPDQATCSTSYSATGSDTVTATYNGDSNYSGSESPGKGESIGPAATSVSLSTNTSSPVVGQKVTFTATVSVQSPGTGVPTGPVKFTGDAGQLCLVGLDDMTPDQATCTTTYSTSGSDSVTAVYEGASSYASSTSNSVGETISKAQTSVTITSSAEPSVTGEKLTFTADVRAVAPGKGVPSGTVVFTIETFTDVFITCKRGDTITLSGGAASCKMSPKKLIAYESPLLVTANYQASSGYLASSSSIRQDIYAANTKTVLTPSANPITPGEPVMFTAKVSAKAPGSGTPTGTVKFTFSPAGSIACTGGSTVNLVAGQATCSIPSGSIEATVTVKAMYSGTTPPAYISSSATLVETVS